MTVKLSVANRDRILFVVFFCSNAIETVLRDSDKNQSRTQWALYLLHTNIYFTVLTFSVECGFNLMINEFVVKDKK